MSTLHGVREPDANDDEVRPEWLAYGGVVAALRDAAGFGQNELARRASVDRGLLSKIVNGKQGASDDVKAALAQALNTTVPDMERAAGLLSPEEYAREVRRYTRLPDAIRGAKELTEKQRHGLLAVYRSYVARNPDRSA